jgi:WD40 repeat protein
MKIITGDETGLLKLVDTIKKTTSPFGTQSRQLGIQKMCWLIPNVSFALARNNGLIEIWKLRSKILSKDRTYDLNLPSLLGISALNESTLLCYSSTGTVAQLNLNEDSPDSEPIFMTHRGPIECLECCYGLSRYACGGLDNDLQLYDLNSSSPLVPFWSAKNVPHDNVRLAVPIFITTISFLRDQTENDGNLIVTGTGHRHVRLYDIRTKRQPIRSWEPMEYKVTNVHGYYSKGSSPSYKVPTANSTTLPTAGGGTSVSSTVLTSDGSIPCCLITDCSGAVQTIDLMTGKLRASYTTSGGSIKDLSVTNCQEYFTTVSYDRYVRVFEVNHSTERFHCYLKNRLTACLVVNEDGEEGGKGKKGKRQKGRGEDGTEEGNENGEDVVENYVDSDDEEEEDDDDDDDDDDEDSAEEEEDDEEGGDDDEEEDDDDDEEEEEEEESEEEDTTSRKQGRRIETKKPDQKRQIQPMKAAKVSEKKPKYR